MKTARILFLLISIVIFGISLHYCFLSRQLFLEAEADRAEARRILTMFLAAKADFAEVRQEIAVLRNSANFLRTTLFPNDTFEICIDDVTGDVSKVMVGVECPDSLRGNMGGNSE